MLRLAALMTLIALPAAAQTPKRFLTFENETWGYVQAQGDPPAETSLEEGPGSGVRLGLRITILTRDGRAVSAADAEDAWFAANEICRDTRRSFDPNARPTLLRRGGLAFPGACG